jgi:hypothetical protein
VVVPSPNVKVVAPTDEKSALLQGSTLAIIDLTIDDLPFDKGKQKADIKMVDAPDRPGTSITSGDDVAEASARWPDFIGLVLARAEEELPHWGRSTLEFRDALTPTPSPSLPLMIRMKYSTGSTSRDFISTPCSPYGWLRTPLCRVCWRPLR